MWSGDIHGYSRHRRDLAGWPSSRSAYKAPSAYTEQDGIVSRSAMAQSEPEPQESQLGDAVLDSMRGALRILGGMVQMAAGMTRLLAVAVLKAAAAAEKAVEASEEDEEKPEPKPKPR